MHSGDSRSFSWGGMSPGQFYLVQIWISDPRSIGRTRWAHLSGDGDVSPNVYYLADGTGVGSDIIETFVADASGNQTVTIDPSALVNGEPGSGSAQINLIQVRLIPEPASAGLAGLGMITCLLRRRRSRDN